MPVTEIVSAIESWDEIVEKWQVAYKELGEVRGPNAESLDLDSRIPNASMSLNEVDAKISSCYGLIGTLSTVEDAPVVPMKWLLDLSAQTAALKERILRISNSIEAALNDGGLQQIDASNFTLVGQNSGATVDLKNLLPGIWDELSRVLETYHLIALIIGQTAAFDFSRHLSASEAAIADIRRAKQALDVDLKEANKKLATVLKAAEGEKAKAEQERAEAEKAKQTIEAIAKETGQKRDSINQYESDAAAKSAEVSNHHDTATALEQSVTAYQAKFDQFDKAMSDREAALEAGTKKQNTLIEDVEHLKNQVEDITNRANSMLSGATTASLASSFATRRDDLTNELDKARRAFYFAIAFLAISAFPLFDFINPFGQKGDEPEISFGIFAAEVFARSVLLFPAGWLTTFAAVRHRRLLRLREHYGYKSSVAESVDGFKAQAEGYKDDIAAAAFIALTDNPADRMDDVGDVSGEQHPNTIMRKLMDRIGVAKS